MTLTWPGGGYCVPRFRSGVHQQLQAFQLQYDTDAGADGAADSWRQEWPRWQAGPVEESHPLAARSSDRTATGFGVRSGFRGTEASVGVCALFSGDRPS